MNKAMYNWLDEQEGLAKGTTIKNIKRQCEHIYRTYENSRSRKCLKCKLITKK